MQKAVLIERQIVDKAIEAFTLDFPMHIEWETAGIDENGQIDGFLKLPNKRLAAEVKGDFRMHQLGKILEQKSKYGDLILIASILSKNVKEKLKKEGISYLDTSGNAYLFYPPHVIIANESKNKRLIKNNTKDKAFTKTGIKLVFAYLNDSTLLQQPYRYIQEKIGVSLHTITKTNESLKQQGFIQQLKDKTYSLSDKNRLLKKWMDIYDTRIKPKFFYGRYSFLNTEAEKNWKNIQLKEDACWGGEAAADLQTNFIRPAIFTLYSTASKGELMKSYRFKPDPNGNIHVYLPFTNLKDISVENEGCTLPILTYTDLVNSGDARNIEVAQKIYEQNATIFI